MDNSSAFSEYMGQLSPPQTSSHLGYSVRGELYPGESQYFQKNPHVSGMAAEDGKIILNPFSPEGVDKEAVIKNEALRLYMKDNNIEPSFEITDKQRKYFKGTPYEKNPLEMLRTLLSRIYTGDPSANLTGDEREAFQRQYLKSILSSAGVRR